MKIGIIGAGHAGVKAAETVAAQGAEVHLYSDENMLPYYRPKLVGYAFGQASLTDITMHDAAWYESRKIDLRLGIPVTGCDLATRSLTSKRGTEKYDAVIFAIGSCPAVPPFARAALEYIHPLWNIVHADAIRTSLAPARKMAIIGGGILGVEVAHRAALANLDVVLVERLNHLMESNLCAEASEVIENILRAKGVKLRLGTSVASLEKKSDGSFHLSLPGGEDITADLVVLAVGARRDISLAKSAGLKCGKGILVSKAMQSSDPAVFAGGDVAEWPAAGHFSVLEAVLQGKIAATNALAGAQGGALVEHKPAQVPVYYSYEGFSVNSIGLACKKGVHGVVLEHSAEVYRGLLVKDDVLVGIQMAGSITDFKIYEKQIGQKL